MPRPVAILRSKPFVVLVCTTEGLHEPTICPDAGSVKRVLPDSWSCTALSVSVCFALCSSVFGSIEASEQSVHENNCIGPRFAPKKAFEAMFCLCRVVVQCPYTACVRGKCLYEAIILQNSMCARKNIHPMPCVAVC